MEQNVSVETTWAREHKEYSMKEILSDTTAIVLRDTTENTASTVSKKILFWIILQFEI